MFRVLFFILASSILWITVCNHFVSACDRFSAEQNINYRWRLQQKSQQAATYQGLERLVKDPDDSLSLEQVLDELTDLNDNTLSPSVIMFSRIPSQTLDNHQRNLINKGVLIVDQTVMDILHGQMKPPGLSSCNTWIPYILKHYVLPYAVGYNEIDIQLVPQHGEATELVCKVGVKKSDGVRSLFIVKASRAFGKSYHLGLHEPLHAMIARIALDYQLCDPALPEIKFPIKSFILDEGAAMDSWKRYRSILFMPVARGKSFEEWINDHREDNTSLATLKEAAYAIGRKDGAFQKRFLAYPLAADKPFLPLDHPDSHCKNVLYDPETESVSWIDLDQFGTTIHEWARNNAAARSGHFDLKEERPRINFSWQFIAGRQSEYTLEILTCIYTGFFSVWNTSEQLILVDKFLNYNKKFHFCNTMYEQKMLENIKEGCIRAVNIKSGE